MGKGSDLSGMLSEPAVSATCTAAVSSSLVPLTWNSAMPSSSNAPLLVILPVAAVAALLVSALTMQSQGGATGYQHAYTSVFHALRSLLRDEG